jgi:hypothetical protein
MRRLLFFLSIGVSIILLIRIIRIVVIDLPRLTEYGYGYLVGKVLLLLIFITIIFLTRKGSVKSKGT